MRPAALGALARLAVLLLAALVASGEVTPRRLRDAWRGAGALGGPLTDSLACDLVTDWRRERYPGSPQRCEGAVESLSDDVARYTEVVWDGRKQAVCLARVGTWRVLRATGGVPCFAAPPQAPPDAPTVTVRAAERERADAWALDLLEARLRRVVEVASRSTGRASECRRERTALERDVPALELEVVRGARGEDSWAFLSTPWLRSFVVQPDQSTARAAVATWSRGRPWVAVVAGELRERPRLTPLALGAKPDFVEPPFERGRFAGRLLLIDAEFGELLCEAPLAFESSARLSTPTLKVPGSRIEVPMPSPLTTERLMADFELRYQAEAGRVLSRMTAHGAWLNFSP